LRGRPREGRPGGRPRIPRRRAGVHRDSRLTRTGGFGAVRRNGLNSSPGTAGPRADDLRTSMLNVRDTQPQP
jgi:hypothetical protein